MIFNKNRVDGNPKLAERATIYLNGNLIDRCIEAQTPGESLVGNGYIIRPAGPGDIETEMVEGLACIREAGYVEVRLRGTTLKGKVERLQGWRAFIKITSLDEKDIAPLCFELPLDRFAISAGDDIELRIGKSNVDVTK